MNKKRKLCYTIENHIGNHIGNINPYRYRSYYYDTETKLYYLNSRYYNPLWGRFINADGIIGANQDILSYNLYAYCSNNPIMNTDIDGNFAIALVSKVVGELILLAATYYAAKTAAPTIARGLTSVKSKTKSKSKLKSKTTTKEKTKVGVITATKVKTTTATNNYTYKPCTTAWINPITHNVDRGKRLTISESVNMVLSSKNVMCDYRISSEKVAKEASNNVGKGYYYDPPHNGGMQGYYPHFHVRGIPKHPHIWYYQ